MRGEGSWFWLQYSAQSNQLGKQAFGRSNFKTYGVKPQLLRIQLIIYIFEFRKRFLSFVERPVSFVPLPSFILCLFVRGWILPSGRSCLKTLDLGEPPIPYPQLNVNFAYLTSNLLSFIFQNYTIIWKNYKIIIDTESAKIPFFKKRSHNINRSCFRIICFGKPYVNQLFNTGCNPDHGQQVQNNNWRRKLRILLTTKSIPSRWRRREPVWWRHVTLKWCHVTHIVISYESAEIEPPHGPDNCLKVRTILNFRTLFRHFWLPDTVDFQDFL